MRSSSNRVPKHSSSHNSYSPNVPLSVYRELAAELQAAAAMLNSLNAQNQQLAKQNQQLRQEIEQVFQYVMHLQRVVDATVDRGVDVYDPNEQSKTKSSRTISSPRSMPSGSGRGAKKNKFVQVESVQDRSRRLQPDSSEMGGGRLAIAILLVIFTAFGAGYFLVRPLLSHR